MLKVLVLAPGRSGSKSFTSLLQNLCRANGSDWIVKHQTEQALVTPAAEAWLLRKNPEPARQVLRGWKHQIEVSGNQNAFLGPIFREVCGEDLKIIRLRRNRDAHLKSFCTGPKVSPEVWGGYHGPDSDYAGPLYWFAPTAVWFGEMTQGEWNSLLTAERVTWYLDTLQRWMDEMAAGFESVFDIRTEELNQPETIDAIARFLNPSWTKRTEPVHQNQRSFYDYSKLSVAQAKEARRLWEGFDFQRALGESNYLLNHALEKAIESASDPLALLTNLENKIRSKRERRQESLAKLDLLESMGRQEDPAHLHERLELLMQIGRHKDAFEMAGSRIARAPRDRRALQLGAEAADKLEHAAMARRWREQAALEIAPSPIATRTN